MATKLPPAPIRAGSQSASVYNEALLAYLYDPAHEAEIVALLGKAKKELGDDGCNKDAALAEIAQRGLMLTYELYQDDSLDIEFAIGEPPTKIEKRAVPYLKALQGLIHITSGKLAVHSANTLPFGEPDENEKAAFIEVPSGDYLATVMHIDGDELHRRFGDDLEEWEGPIQFITLTPLQEAVPPKKPMVYLEYPVSGVRSLRRWKMKEGVFSGEVIGGSAFGIGPITTNLPRSTSQELGIQFGSIHELHVEGNVYHVIHCENINTTEQAQAALGPAYEEIAASFEYPIASCFGPCQSSKEDRLRLFTLDPSKRADIGTDDDPFTLQKASALANYASDISWSYDRPVVLGWSPYAMFVGARLEDLGAVGDDVYLEIGGIRRRVRLSTDANALTESTRYSQTPPGRFAEQYNEAKIRREKLIEKAFGDVSKEESDNLWALANSVEKEMASFRRPDEALDAMPFVANVATYWLDSSREVLLLRALWFGADLELQAKIGDEVHFTK